MTASHTAWTSRWIHRAPHERSRPWPSAHSSPASPARTAPTSPSCCWRRATRCTGSSAAPRPSTPSRIDHLYVDPHDPSAKLFLHYGDLSDGARLVTLLAEIQPDEVYNLAAQSHVRVSFDEPEHTADTTGIGTIRLLEAVRMSGIDARFYQASSSEMFGATPPPQNEKTPFYPRSPYGAAKVYSYWITKNYREAYGMFAVNGILFNHESPRRGETFVTRKITRAVAAIKAGKQDHALPGQPRRRPRLGLRRRVRRGHVAHAAGRRARRLRARHRRRHHGARLPRDRRSSTPASTGRSTSVRRALPAPDRGRRAHRRRRRKAARRARLEGHGRRPRTRASSWSTPTSRRSSTRARRGSTACSSTSWKNAA